MRTTWTRTGTDWTVAVPNLCHRGDGPDAAGRHVRLPIRRLYRRAAEAAPTGFVIGPTSCCRLAAVSGGGHGPATANGCVAGGAELGLIRTVTSYFHN